MRKLNIAFVLFTFSSCVPVYIPNIRNSPMFTKGGEFQASAQIGNGLEAQAALSISDHVGILSNYSFADRGSLNPDRPDEFHKHKLFEGGIGYFSNKENVFFEFFVGYGKGEGSSYDQFQFLGSTGDEQATGKFERYFFQPAIGFNKSAFHISFAPRISSVDFYEFSNSLGQSIRISEPPKIFIEPAICSRINFSENQIFVASQFGFSASFSEDVYFKYRPFQFSLGLGFRLGGIKDYPEK